MSTALNDTLANFCCTKCTNTPKRTRARAHTHTALQEIFDRISKKLRLTCLGSCVPRGRCGHGKMTCDIRNT